MRTTTAYKKISALRKKIRVVQGGQGASKTYSILQRLALLSIKLKLRGAVVTDTYTNLKDGVIADMQTILTNEGYDWDKIFNKSDKDLTLEDSKIHFRNLDSKDFNKKKGVRYDFLFINEGNRMGWQSIDQMFTRSKVIIIDFNPDEEFWAHTKLMTRDDCDFIILTYKDNEMLSKEERDELEYRYQMSLKPDAPQSLKDWVNVYVLGQTGTYSDRRIYNYKFIDDIPQTARRIRSGMDFGISPDKTALIDLYIDGINLYADERFSLNNLREEKIPGDDRMSIVDQMELIQFPKGHQIIADSAGRVSILDLRKHGYNILAVKKYQGSQRDGIAKFRGYNLHITKRSINLKKDIESFYWKQDMNGKVIPEPDGHEPDTLVSIRYALMMENR